MFSFWRPREFKDPHLGPLTRIGKTAWWYSESVAGGLGVTLEGNRDRPDAHALEIAQRLLLDTDTLVPSARALVLQNKEAIDFIQAGGKLVCDGYTVQQSGEFAVEFSLSNWPDAMITVPFKDGVPCEVQLAD
jgi:hypothetical protein